MDDKLRLVYLKALELEEDDDSDPDNLTELLCNKDVKEEVDDEIKVEVDDDVKVEVDNEINVEVDILNVDVDEIDQKYEPDSDEQIEEDVIEMVDLNDEESATDLSECEMVDDDSDGSSDESSSDSDEFSGLCDSELDVSDEFDVVVPLEHGPPNPLSRNIPVCSADSVWKWVSPPEEELGLPRKFTVRDTGPQNFSKYESPVDYFSLFMTKSVLRKMVQATNAQAKVRLQEQSLGIKKNYSRMNYWVDVTIEEMQKFWSVLINMGLTKRKCYKDMWDMTSTQFIPFFSQTMSLRRFELIKSMLRLSARENESNPLDSVKEFMVRMNKKFKLYHIPEQEVQISAWTMALKNKTVVLNHKPIQCYKQGFKMFELSDSFSSYVYHVGVYSAKEFFKNSHTFTQNVMEEIMIKAGFTGKGHHLFTNVMCDKISLAEKLLTMETFLTSPVKNPKVELSNVIAEMLVQPGENLYLRKGPILVVGDKAWKGKKQQCQCLVTTGCHAENVSVQDQKKMRPLVKERYKHQLKSLRNKNNRDVFLTCNAGARQFWKKILFYFVDMALLNAYILYKSQNLKPLSQKDFLIQIVQTLSQSTRVKDIVSFRPPADKFNLFSNLADNSLYSSGHYLESMGRLARICVVCKARGIRKRSANRCHGCKLAVHQRCFAYLRHS